MQKIVNGFFTGANIGLLLLIIVSIPAFSITYIRSLDGSILKKSIYLDHGIENFEIVIARYNEDLSWLENEFTNEKITIYNKGKDDIKVPPHLNYKIIKLPNLGRESHTYLYHIINNYDNLAARTLFLQGDPYDPQVARFMYFPLEKYKRAYHFNCGNIIARQCYYSLDYLINKSLSPETFIKEDPKYGNTKFKDYNFAQFRKLYDFKKSPFDVMFKVIPGSNFAVDKNKILLREKDFYVKLFSVFDSIAPIEGFYMERLWISVFK